MRPGLYHSGLYEPWKTEAYQDVENIATYGVTDRHVTKTLFNDRQWGKGVRHTHTSGNESQSHHGVGNAQSTACKINHFTKMILLGVGKSSWRFFNAI